MKKVAIITGAGKRLGKEIALALAGSDFNIVANYNSSKRGAELVVKEIEKAGGKAISVKADVKNKNEIVRLFKKAYQTFGRIDLLVNNSAVFIKKEFSKIDESFWDKVIDTNLKSCFLCSCLASKYMKKQGSGKIINISSAGAFTPFKGYLPYCVSKAGVVMLTKCLAKELAPKILVNSIAPGVIDFNDEKENLDNILKTEKIPLKKYGSAKDITELVLFLADSGNYITGQTFIVDGGKSLN